MHKTLIELNRDSTLISKTTHKTVFKRTEAQGSKHFGQAGMYSHQSFTDAATTNVIQQHEMCFI
ncbi:unnamed protein product [Ixodes persulcatus]